MLEVVERADEDKDHLLVELGDVVPDAEDDCAEFTGDRDSVLSVQLLVFIGLAFGHQVPVHDTGLDVGGELDEQLTVAELGVVETFDGSLKLANLVDPVKKIFLGLRSDNLEVVDAHELPDHSKDVLLDTLTDVLGADSDKLDTKGLHGGLSHVTVVVTVEHVLRGHVGLGPVDGSVINAMANAQDHKTVTHLFEKVLDEAVLQLHGVDPKTE